MFAKLFSTSSDVIKYQPLEQPTTIRIVVLQQGSRKDPVKCSIIHTELSEKPYQALSYEWGLPNNGVPISLDGNRVRIRRNLYEALGAENVIAWLGVARDNSDMAMDILADDEFRYHIMSGHLGKTEQQALLTLCHRPYWLWVWIVQELFLARSIVLWCGSKFISEERLGDFLATVSGCDKYEYCQRISKSPADTHRRSRQFRGTSLHTMGRWLRIFVGLKFKTSQPRDVIYAVLAISSDCDSSQIRPDYSKPLRDMYLETLTVYCVHENKEYSENFARIFAAYLGLVIDEELERCLLDIIRSQAHRSTSDDSTE
ncbi:hypothetical protein VE03_00957 [Pseudogymnoascus sp. 23342-1-I1]|nr:hypothetical protein VE03_00957 [Pseudogymnoascus sp. 23342-1-I1]